MNIDQIINTVSELRTERDLWIPHWEECANFAHPRRNTFFTDQVAGRNLQKNVFTSIASRSNNRFAGMIHGAIANPSSRWHGLTSGDEETDQLPAVADYFENANERLESVFRQSNLQAELPMVFKDLGSIGTAPLMIEEDEDTIVRFSSKPVIDLLSSGFFFLSSNDPSETG